MSQRIVPAPFKGFYDNYHFAPAVIDGDHLRCSGMIGNDSEGKCDRDPEAQFERAFQNLKIVLEEGGASFHDITEMTTFHVGLNEHLGTFMKVKDRYILAPYPAWTAIGVSELALPGALVEIRVTARLP